MARPVRGLECRERAGKPAVHRLAQQVEAVAPSLVSTDADGNKGVNYPLTVPLLIEAVKELKLQNDALRADHGAVLARLKQLEERN